MMQQPPSQDIATLAYRIASIEQNVQHLQTELRSYVPARENDLQLQSIRSTVERIEGDVKEARKQIGDLGTQVTVQRQERDDMLIHVLKWVVITIVSALVTIAIALFIYYFEHPGGF